jgi:hypothetical protein
LGENTMAGKTLTIEDVAKKLLESLSDPLRSLNIWDEGDELFEESKGKLIILIKLLEFLSEHNYSFTESELDMITEVKKLIYPKRFKESKKVAV